MSEQPTTSVSSVAALQAILEEEKQRRIDAENMAQALVEEFRTCGDFEEVRTKFRDKVKEFAPAALINIINMANGAESESVRASLNKWIIEWAMSDKIDNPGGELAGLLNKLKKQPTGPAEGS